MLTKEQIKRMVDRFLSWRLPNDFSPDGGISFEPIGNAGTGNAYTRQPTGTNLLDYNQATAMVAHMLEGIPNPALVQWAVDRWNDEVKNRPLQNVHRRSLDDAWRQVMRHGGGDPVALVGPSHDDLLAGDSDG